MKFEEKLAAAQNAPRPFDTMSVALDTIVSRKRETLGTRLDVIVANLDEAEDRLDAAKNPGPDARLSKNTGVKAIEAEITSLEKDRDALRDEIMALEPEFADTLVDLKFVRVPGDEWAEMVMHNPIRQDVLIDKVLGYNVPAVTRVAALKYGFVVEGDADIQLTADQWDQLFNTISGSEMTNVLNTIYSLNAGEPEQAVEIAKKASAAMLASVPTSEPPSQSE
jgi:hypothetical protein